MLPQSVFLPERSLLTLDVFTRGRRVRVNVGNAVLALLDRRPVETEADQVRAFERCRPRIEALVGQLLAEGRGARGGLIVTPEDVSACTPANGAAG